MQYTIKNGVPVFSSDAQDPDHPTQSERDTVLAFAAQESAINEAEALYKTLKAKRVIDGYDLSDTFEFDFQRKAGGSVRMKKAGGKTETKTKAQTDVIEGKLFAYLNSCSDALDADIDAINDSGDFTLSNLNAI